MLQQLPCPECKCPIPVSINQLLAGHPLACLNPVCGVSLSIDHHSSHQALEKVRKLKKGIDAFEAKKKKLGA